MSFWTDLGLDLFETLFIPRTYVPIGGAFIMMVHDDRREKDPCECPYGLNTVLCSPMPCENARSICERNCDHKGSIWRSNPSVVGTKVILHPVLTSHPLEHTDVPTALKGVKPAESAAHELLSDEYINALPEHHPVVARAS